MPLSILRSRSLQVAMGFLAICLMSKGVWAQATASASITGQVVDESEHPMPSVDVTLTSPALQVAEVRATTDAQGEYQVLYLPSPGIYRAAFARQGFRTYIWDGLSLSAGFAARIDVVMKLGPISQSIEVTGTTPVIDTVNTSGGLILPSSEITDTPKGEGVQELFPMATGISLTGKPDVGDSNLASRAGIITHGVLLEPTIEIEGINTTTSRDLDTAVYFDTYALGEAQFSTVGNNADVAFPGVHMVGLVKTGSNTLHGSLTGDYESASFQSNNITPALAAQGQTLSNPIHNYYDYSGDLGGRVIRDKLWFYGGFSKQLIRQGQLGFVSGPDAAGCWTCPDAPEAALITSLWEGNLKISYQPNATTRIIGTWLHSVKFLNASPASSSIPLPASQMEDQPINLWKAELEKTMTPNVFVDVEGGYAGYHAQYTTEPGTDRTGDPSSEELTTGFYTGPYPAPTDRPQNRYEGKGTVSYVRGAHLFKFGTDLAWEEGDTRILGASPRISLRSAEFA